MYVPTSSIESTLNAYAGYHAYQAKHTQKRAAILLLASLVKEQCMLKGYRELCIRVNNIIHQYLIDHFPSPSREQTSIFFPLPDESEYQRMESEVKVYTSQLRGALKSIVNELPPSIKDYWNEEGSKEFCEKCQKIAKPEIYEKEMGKFFPPDSNKRTFTETKSRSAHTKRARAEPVDMRGDEEEEPEGTGERSTFTTGSHPFFPVAGEARQETFEVTGSQEEEESEEKREGSSSNFAGIQATVAKLKDFPISKILFFEPNKTLAISRGDVLQIDTLSDQLNFLHPVHRVTDCAATPDFFMTVQERGGAFSLYSQTVWVQDVKKELGIDTSLNSLVEFPIHSMTNFSNSHFVLGDHKGNVHFIEAASGKPAATCSLSSSKTIVTLDTSSTLAVASCDRRVFILPFGENGLPSRAEKYQSVFTKLTAEYLNLWNDNLIFCQKNTLTMLDLNNFSNKTNLSIKVPFIAKAIQRSENLLFGGDASNTVQIWDLRHASQVHQLQVPSTITTLAIREDTLLCGTLAGIFCQDMRMWRGVSS